MFSIRLMTQEDVPALTHLQLECYGPQLQEDESTFRARLLLAPDTAWVAGDASGVCAYLVCYRSTVGKITPLNGVFDIPPNADALYLHDLAVGNRCRGRGVGKALVQVAWQKAEAEGLEYSALVSVQDSKGFWQRLGYQPWDGLGAVQLANLKTYPDPSFYMVKSLRPPR